MIKCNQKNECTLKRTEVVPLACIHFTNVGINFGYLF